MPTNAANARADQTRTWGRVAVAGLLTASVLAMAPAAHASAGSLSSLKRTATDRTQAAVTHMASLRRKTGSDSVRPYKKALDVRFVAYENRLRALDARVQAATTSSAAAAALTQIGDRYTDEQYQLHAVEDAYSVVFLSTVDPKQLAALTELVANERTMDALTPALDKSYHAFMTSPLRTINGPAKVRLAKAIADDIDRPGFRARELAISAWASGAPRGVATFVPEQLSAQLVTSGYALLYAQARYLTDVALRGLGDAVTQASWDAPSTELAAAPGVFATWTYPGPATDQVTMEPALGTVKVVRVAGRLKITAQYTVAEGADGPLYALAILLDGKPML